MSQKKAQILNPLTGNINVAGVITASSFVGSGEGLTGVASTDNIQTATEATFLSGVKITGVTTASGGVVGNLTGNVTGNATGLSGTPNITVGSVNASSGTISDNVTIGGTLTYQDVTNIDSIGIITAQQGIQVLANGLDITGFSTFKTGVSVTGVVTATSFSGNVTGNLTGDVNAATFDTGVGGVVVTGVVTATSFTGDGSGLTGTTPSVSLVASGTLSNGQTVIIQSDGKVAGVVTTGIGQSLTSEVIFQSGSSEIQFVEATYDTSNNKIVYAYQNGNDSTHGYAVVGTVTGTAVTFGTPVEFENASVSYLAMTFDSSNNKVVIAYRDDGNSGSGTAVVGTVSGDTISFGTPVTFSSAIFSTSMAFDSSNNKVVIAYRDQGGTTHGKAIVGEVSGTTISFGSAVTFESAAIGYDTSMTFDTSAEKVLIAYRDDGNSEYGTAIVGTVSGTSISFGSPTVYRTGTSSQMESSYDSENNKHVIVFEDEGSSQVGSAVVGTISGTSVSFGSKVTFLHGSSSFARGDIQYEPTSKKHVLTFRDGSNSSNGTLMVGSVVGTSVTFTNKTVYFDDGESAWQAVAIDTDQKISVIGYGPPTGDGGKGRARVFQPPYTATNLTTENFIGFSDAAYTDGQTAKIQIVTAIDDAQSGLTTGSKHYVQNDGTLGTTADSPSVVAGTAISATKIIIKQ